MGLLNYRKLSKDYSRKLIVNESNTPDLLDKDLDEAVKLSNFKIGGDDEMSFDSLNQILDKIPSDLLKEAELNPKVQTICINLLDLDVMDIVNKYVDKEADELDDIIKRNSDDLGAEKILNRDDSYVSDFNNSANIVVRFEKLYSIYNRSSKENLLDSNTEILKSLRSMGAVINLSTMGLKGSGKIGKIGGIDSDIDPNLFEILTPEESSGSTNIPKESIKNIIKKSKKLSSKFSKKYESEHKRRMVEVVDKSSNSIKKWYNWASKTFNSIADEVNSSDDPEEVIDSADEFLDNTGGSVFNMVFNYGDTKTTLRDEVKQAERRISGNNESRKGLRRKKQIFRRIKDAIATAALPIAQSGEIQREGDYYSLFKVLNNQKEDWMNTILINDIFSGETSEFNNFKQDIDLEDPSESAQLNYLNSCVYWTIKFIESDYICAFNEKEMDSYKKTLESISLEKKTEIRNYYLSKGFNLSDFRSVLIKPEVDIPLYKKVKLAISKEDLIKDSPLMNFLKGSKDTIFSLLGGGIYVDQAALAQGKRFSSQNKSIIKGLSGSLKGIVGIVGGKQVSRNYDTIMNSDNGKVQEDMLSPMDSPSASVSPMEGPGSTFQTPMTMSGDMDTFSLLGPGKGSIKSKKKTKKRKSGKRKKKNNSFDGSRVLNFKEFLKN